MSNFTQSIVLFDGVCHLCNGSVQFILKRDPHAQFVFAPMQGETGQVLIEQYRLDNIAQNSVVLIANGRVYLRSRAALEICRKLRFPYPILCLFWLVPSPIRDWLYNWVARNRYRWFGKAATCSVPTAEQRERFLL